MNRRAFLKHASISAAAACSSRVVSAQLRRPATGPLKVHPRNPRYFTDGSGRAIFLTGAHTWANLQDTGLALEPVTPDKGQLPVAVLVVIAGLLAPVEGNRACVPPGT